MKHTTLFVLTLVSASAAAQAPVVVKKNVVYGNVQGADWSKHPANEWVKQSPTDKQPTPLFGWEGSGAYDPFAKKWIHFGGHDGIPQGFHLFTYDLESRVWEQRFPPNSPAGVCCIDGANTFDVANRRFVNFPGGSLGHGYQGADQGNDLHAANFVTNEHCLHGIRFLNDYW